MANAPGGRDGRPVTIFGPDFPFPFDDWIAHPAGLGSIPAERHGEEVAVIGAGISGLVAAYELMKLGLKPVVYEASQMGGRLRSQPFEGAEGVVAELGGMRFPISSIVLLPLRGQAGPADPPVPQPADRSRRKHGRRPGGRDVLRGLARRPSAAVHRGRRRLGAGSGGGAVHRHPERDPGARRGHAQVVVERPRAPLGRPHVLRLRRHLPGVLETHVPPPRGLRPGRVRHRRLGLGLSQLHAGDLPGRHDQLRHGPAPDRRRRRAGAARALALRRAPARPLAGGHLAGLAALRRAPARRRPDRPRGRRAARGHRRMGHHAPVRRGAGDVPELAAHHADRMRGEPVLREAVDGPGPHPLHAVLQDLRAWSTGRSGRTRTRAPAAT